MTGTIDRPDIERIYTLIQPYVRRTPVVEVAGADFGLTQARVVLKLELLQRAGSFKTRGAFANLLTHKVPPAGVVAASGGNHGAAVAYAAMQLKVPAKIFVPTISSPVKIDRIRAYGADLVVGGERYAEALASSEAWAAETGALQVHAFDQRETLLGQGTVGLELTAQAPELDTLLVAVGGGGLIAGIASWFRGDVRVVGVEPDACPTMYAALAAGEPVDVDVGGIAADSLGPKRVGRIAFAAARAWVDRVVLVPDEAIREGQRRLWRDLHVIAEPGGAASLGALIAGAYVAGPGERVVVVVCGANADPTTVV